MNSRRKIVGELYFLDGQKPVVAPACVVCTSEVAVFDTRVTDNLPALGVDRIGQSELNRLSFDRQHLGRTRELSHGLVIAV